MNWLIQLPVLLFSVIIHEVAHGWVAEKCGDDTARMMGRLTFNPVPHIDMIGTILLPALCLMVGAPIFGWAKPVPVNPYRLRNPDRDIVWVSLAGPGANILLAVAAAIGLWVVRSFIPMQETMALSINELLQLVLVINILLPVFNLFPIPPLDGSKVLMGILPHRWAAQYRQIEPYGFIIIIVLLSTGLFWRILGPIISFLVSVLGGAPNL